jgi:hypothetical protein
MRYCRMFASDPIETKKPGLRQSYPAGAAGEGASSTEPLPRLTAAIPVRQTSTRPSGPMIAMNCSILEVRPVISNTK